MDRALIDACIAGPGPKKLHLGCGKNMLSGWLNSDFFPRSEHILHLDVTRTFPLPTGAFDYIFSEHMIEHFSYSRGLAILGECHRVLRPGGRIRVSTPDLRFLVDLHRGDKSALQNDYITWSSDKFIENAPFYDATFVINNFMRDWGHLFIYDERVLRAAMECAGFVDITRCSLSESREEALRGLEHEKRMPAGFLRLETLTLEGTWA